MEILKEIEKKIKPVDRTINFEIGDTVKVHYRIVEGNRERIQVYEGIVIAIDNKGMSKSFTVRKLSFDVGVERIFPFYSTRIAKIDVVRKGKARRAKLYYLRERTGKSAKLRERNIKASKRHTVDAADVPGTAAEPAEPENTAPQES
jgi:large subunit ribosomal protein L19